MSNKSAKVPLRDVTVPTTNWNPTREPRNVKYVDVSAVSRELLLIESTTEHSVATAPSRARKVIAEGDTIFATVRPSLRRIAQVPAELAGEIASTAFCVLRPDRTIIDPDFLFYAACADDFVNEVVARETGASYPAVRDSDVLDQMIPLPSLDDQRGIAHILGAVRRALLHSTDAMKIAKELKSVVTRRLFTCGLRGEPQKETEIGPLPESWEPTRLDAIARVISTRMSYTELENMPDQDAGLPVLGVKVSDMNLPGNEVVLSRSALQRSLNADIVKERCAPPGAIVFPKRGAAIATNKKRLCAKWTVFDPNVIGVVPGDEIDPAFLFQWFQLFDLKTITEPGPTPQLNKKHLDPLVLPMPRERSEQKAIAGILVALDQQIDLNERKRAVLEELFRGLLGSLMAGDINVASLNLDEFKKLRPAATSRATEAV